MSKMNKIVFEGFVVCRGEKRPFQILGTVFLDKEKLMKELQLVAGSDINVSLQAMEQIRIAAMAFSRRDGIEKIQKFLLPGYHQDQFVMPSVVVTKGDVREQLDSLDLDGHIAQYDFRVLSNDKRDVQLRHLHDEVLGGAFPRRSAILVLAYMLLPATGLQRKTRIRPTFWLHGLTGGGKTVLIVYMMSFWGEFGKHPNWTSSKLSLEKINSECRDMPLYIDDFKGLEGQSARATGFIQYSYDGSAAEKLQKDGALRAAPTPKGSPISSGEGMPCDDASVLSRIIAVEFQGYDHEKTADKFRRAEEFKEFNRGITPDFIQFCMKRGAEKIHADYLAGVKDLQRLVPKAQHASRIASNAGMILASGRLFADYLLEREVVDSIAAASLREEYKAAAEEVVKKMATVCSESLLYQRFLDLMIDLISSKICWIRTREDEVVGGATCIGFVRDMSSDELFISPGVLEMAIRRNGGKDFERFTLRWVKSSLLENGYLLGSGEKNARDLDGVQGKRLVFSMSKLELDDALEKARSKPAVGQEQAQSDAKKESLSLKFIAGGKSEGTGA